MQNGVGRTTHCHVEGDGVVESFQSGDVARFQVMLDELDDGAGGAFIKRLTLLGHGEDGAVAGQRHAERFAKAIH